LVADVDDEGVADGLHGDPLAVVAVSDATTSTMVSTESISLISDF
jgi:hypothetical protein